MERIHSAKVSRSNDSLSFLRGFLRDPVGVGSVIPSSRLMERRIVRVCNAARANVIVELGPGTGGTTRALLRAMKPDATLVGIEIDPDFAEHVERIGDSRLIVHVGSAADIQSILDSHGIPPADVIVSGIPFSTMPPALGKSIVRSVDQALAPRGCFVAYQFRAAVAHLATPHFGRPEVNELETVNIPPMRVYRWRATPKFESA